MQKPHRKRIQITAFPRLHLTLIDLAAGTYRRNGGIGFALNSPLTVLNFCASPTTSLAALCERDYSTDEIETLTTRLETARSTLKLSHGITLERMSPFRRHAGLGTSTAIALSCIEAIFLANDRTAKPKTIQTLSGRGGTSGIGLNTYFTGGLVFDLGREYDNSDYAPSEATAGPVTLPLLCKHVSMPTWQIGYLSPSTIRSIDVEKEKDFFKSTCPIPQASVYETNYHASFGILAAAMEHQFRLFCDSVNALQRCVWKSAEIAIYGNEVANLMGKLHTLGCQAVGMSSLGPGVYFLAHDFERVFAAVSKSFPNEEILSTFSRNAGREVLLG